MPAIKITDDQRTAILSASDSYWKIAQRLGISEKVVARIRREAGIRTKPGPRARAIIVQCPAVPDYTRIDAQTITPNVRALLDGRY